MRTKLEMGHIVNRFHASSIILLMACSLVFSMYFRSWQPILFIGGVLIIGAVVSGSAYSLAAVASRVKPWDNFTPTHISVIAIVIVFVVIGIFSVSERTIWHNSDHIPSWIVAKTYDNRYSANNHRLLKLLCDQQSYHGPMFIRYIGDQVYVRCGEWYPQVYTISANKASFERARAETENDPPGTPVVIGPDD